MKAGYRARLLRKGAAAMGIVVAASPAAASAAVLTVTVAPSTVHPRETYAIRIAGRYGRRASGTPSLLAFIQYTGAACRRTATAEYALPTRDWSWVIYPQRAEPRSPFKQVFGERARTRFGRRRVCAYLYPKKITPGTADPPIAIASAGYSEVRR